MSVSASHSAYLSLCTVYTVRGSGKRGHQILPTKQIIPIIRAYSHLGLAGVSHSQVTRGPTALMMTAFLTLKREIRSFSSVTVPDTVTHHFH